MKTGTVRVSEEFIKPDGTKKWYAHEKQYNQDTEDPQDVFAKAEAEMNAYAKKSIQVTPQCPPAPPTEIPVINKAEERLGILIENASTKEELMTYKDSLTTPYLADLFSSKHQQLLIKR
jgi:hypothetical protein